MLKAMVFRLLQESLVIYIYDKKLTDAAIKTGIDAAKIAS